MQIQAAWDLEGDLGDTFYFRDISPAYVSNDSLYKLAVKMVSEQRIEGIVYHVLKGQIEYDFELGRLEETFEKMDVFSEVLQQKKYGKEALAI
jgi:benzoyl-CoA reductase/2-hydroxyglutaryl-CoA dehydratase subunit BcrC/BadD/HgdB